MTESFNPIWSKDRRKELRKRTTIEEVMLWEFLKARKLLGEKFRRQHGIGPYIADFYCPRIKLVIELDGDVHKNTVEYDTERNAYLKGVGCKVLRFSNELIQKEIDRVLEFIRSEIVASSF